MNGVNDHGHSDDEESDLLVVVAEKAVVADHAALCPVTLEISISSGKIRAVHPGLLRERNEFPGLDQASYIRLESHHVLLPGLVDAVGSS